MNTLRTICDGCRPVWTVVATWLSAVATVVTAVTAIVAVCFAVAQLDQATLHKQWQNYNELNQRYSDLLKDKVLPGSNEKREVDAGQQQLWAPRYFDLTSEEYWLQQNKLLPPHTWACRIAPGVVRNFREIDFLPQAYEQWKKDVGPIHPADFVQTIDAIRRELPPCTDDPRRQK